MNFMDASYGHGAAGIDMVSKRGSNAFHGVVYDFVRNRALQAGQFFRPPPGAPRFTLQPVRRERRRAHRQGQNIFFRKLRGPPPRDRNHPSGSRSHRADEGRRLQRHRKIVRDPLNSNLPFPGNVIPRKRLDRISNEMVQYFPAANSSACGPE